ncbi:MAG: DEAD/DEAH box helicase [Oscillochloridaceae bacterium umkhey_bin13]
MLFTDLLSRADEGTLQTLLGRSALRLLQALDPTRVSPSAMRELVLGLHSPAALLRDPMARGLLLTSLRPVEAARLVTILGLGPAADPYATLANLKLRRGSTREQDLLDFFEIVTPDLPPPPEQHADLTNLNATVALFLHQRDAARRVRQALQIPPQRVLLHMPTGAGKTRTAMHIVADHLRQHEPSLVVWLASSEELCEQAASSFAELWQHLGDRDLPLLRFWGSYELDLEQAHDGFVVASLPKLYRAAMGQLSVIGRLASRCTLVVLDEAHQAVAETYDLVVSTLVTQGRPAALLGLTATPGRSWDDQQADAQLAAFFAERKVTLHVPGYASPVDYLVDQGYLARAHFRALSHQGGIELSAADLRRIERELDLSAELLQRLGQDEQRNLALIVACEALIQRHRRIMVFATSVEHAHLLAAVLRARGHWAAAIDGSTPPLERSRLIRDYRAEHPEPRLLCNYGVLTTGFDAPQTSAALIARPTRSLILYSQMVGRAIRGPRVGGNANAEIVTVVDRELPGFGSLAEAFANWEDVWKEP